MNIQMRNALNRLVPDVPAAWKRSPRESAGRKREERRIELVAEFAQRFEEAAGDRRAMTRLVQWARENRLKSCSRRAEAALKEMRG